MGLHIGSDILKLAGEDLMQQFETGLKIWAETIVLDCSGRKEQAVWVGLGGIASEWS